MKKSFKCKLVFKKSTVSNLNYNEMIRVIGARSITCMPEMPETDLTTTADTYIACITIACESETCEDN